MGNDFWLDDQFDSDIDLTPLIDVVFLLIIFFVLATSFSKPVLEIVLPGSDTAEEEIFKNGDIIVEINRDGEIYCGAMIYTEENIMELINMDRSSTMILHVDKEAPFEAFLLIIDSAKKIERDNIVVVTDDEND
ncbi:MAG: biopolymer transporter ExbD [Candidatus Sabulitectum sp.]|nr:biopolymer transporter ExbD [Candidatus Sabulitectum sp.]